MELVFCKSKWEMWDDPTEDFIRRARGDGFRATELYLAAVTEPADEIKAMHRTYGLDLLGQILTKGETVTDHLRSLDEQFDFALRCGSFLINLHAGRDVFSVEENL